MKSSAVIIAIFLFGILFGTYDIIPVTVAEDVLAITVGIILFAAGVTIGINKGIVSNIRYYGIRALYIPLFTAVGTFLCTAIAWVLYIKLPFWDTLAASSGFVYYSFSSAVVGDLFYVELGAITLLVNMLLEIWALTLAPVFVRFFGPLAPITVSGVSSMDVCLPVIMRTSGKEYFIYAVVNGIIMHAVAPGCIYLFYFLSKL